MTPSTSNGLTHTGRPFARGPSGHCLKCIWLRSKSPLLLLLLFDEEDDDDAPVPSMAHSSLISSVIWTIIFLSCKNQTKLALRQFLEKASMTSLAAAAIWTPLLGYEAPDNARSPNKCGRSCSPTLGSEQSNILLPCSF